MSIDKINGLNKIFKKTEITKAKPTKNTSSADKISISDKAKEFALRDKYIKMIKDAPEIDNSQKIEKLKKDIDKPDYINQKIIDHIAKKIAESMGIE